MRCYIVTAVLAALVVWSVPASASLPYYNQDLGYTIWLSGEWSEAPDAYLSTFGQVHDGVAAHMVGWEAGYTLKGKASASLLVSQLHGRVVSKASIGNFNQHVIKGIARCARDVPEWTNQGRVQLNKANFNAKKNMLRLEMDATDPAGKHTTTIVYIVYTSTGMLKFVGLVEPGDRQGVQAIDDAVSTLYLDYGLRQ